MKKIYLDYAATTPVDILVEKVMKPYFNRKFGNPSSLHFFGQEALAVIDESRAKIAKNIGADFKEIVFTGSATEANNLVLRGIVKNVKQPRIIISAIEHESVLETARDLEKTGVEVIYLPVNRDGIVDLVKLKKSLNERTVLISIMYANNEIGIIQPIAEIMKIIKNFRKINNLLFPLLHTDAVQAFQFLDCDVNKLGVDLMTLSAHKIYGPKGIGALYIRQKKELDKKTIIHNSKFIIPNITGGGQEFGLRSGTENVAGIAGFAKAVELAAKNREKENKRIGELSGYFWKEIKKIYPKAKINGPKIGAKNRLPNILNIYYPDNSAEDLLIKLDLAGVAVSSGSACSSRALSLSHVLKACGFSDKRIKSSLRFSFGRFTTMAEIKEALKKMKIII